MEETEITQPAPRKRGRPREYPNAQAKAAAKAQRKRAKRAEEAAKRQEKWHNTFFVPELPSVLPELPSMMDDKNAALQQSLNGSGTASGMPSGIEAGLPNNSEDLATLLLPDNSLPEELFLDPTLAGDDLPGELDLPTNDGVDTLRVGSEYAGTNLQSNSTEDTNEYLTINQTDSITIQDLACQLTEQLIAFKGCCHECHRDASLRRLSGGQQSSLSTYLASVTEKCPDILGSNRIASRTDDLAAKTNPESRREVYCGLVDDKQSPIISLHEDEHVTEEAGVTLDIDSITGFLTSLAASNHGIRWYPTQMAVSDLQSDLHLRPREVRFLDATGRSRHIHRPVHKIPHYTFGRLIGFEDISLYLLFPRLYREEQQSSRIRDTDFRVWMDDILLPIVYQHYSSAHVQHYPSSYDHSLYNSTARSVETRAQRIEPLARQQQLMYYLPPESLQSVWDSILAVVQRPGLEQFKDVEILLQAKNLKVLTKDTTWDRMMSRFHKYWSRAIDNTYTTEDFYFDVGKETCPRQASQVMQRAGTVLSDAHNAEVLRAPAETLLYKRCCLTSYANSIRQSGGREHTQRDVFYHFSMLHDSGSLTIENGLRSSLRQAGLIYTQFYSSVKEIFAAGNVYPFTNSAIETLALDKRLRKTWETVGGGLSHKPAALMKAYLYTKLRSHHALQGSIRKSFGVREEHRVSKSLFYAMDTEFRNRELHNKQLLVTTNEQSPYFSFRTETVLRWLRWNINKFCVGFETVYSFQDPHFVTWEHTRMMLMFLRCLQFSYSGGLMQRVGGCWRDLCLRPDSRQPSGIRKAEGLGFQRTIDDYGYAWFMDKVDWATLTFRQPHAAYMMFNNPSMQAAYHGRYRQIRDVRVDFIRVDKARQWMIEFSSIPACLDLLESYLKQLCLCAFRKDVFNHVKAILHPSRTEAALAGEIPLCYETVNEALAERYRPPRVVHGPRIGVQDMEVMFSWLWDWKEGHFQHKGWEGKPYRMLFHQSFYMVKDVRGKASARDWRKSLKKSFVGSHWMLPYPQNTAFMRKDKESKEFVWWPSFHRGLDDYYQQVESHGKLRKPLPSTYIKHHPNDGWKLAPDAAADECMPYVVQPEQDLLRLSEEGIYAKLVSLREHWSAGTLAPQPDPNAVVLEFNIRSTNYGRPPPRWDVKHRAYISRTWDESNSPGTCAVFLRQELEKYEVLLHHRRNLRSRNSREISGQIWHGSESAPVSDTDATSDEESLGHKRLRQAKLVRKIDSLMRQLITREREKNKSPKQWEHLEKEFKHRLDNVQDAE